MKLDLLAFGAHPDDVELSCAGTVIKHVALGKSAGIVDLTRGELGTRGTAGIRDTEAAAAAKVMGVHARENLEMRDGFFKNDEEHQRKVITMIRKYQPEIILANATEDRHPDHGRAAELVAEAWFLSGLRKIETRIDGKAQEPWRPKAIYNYVQDRWLDPDILIDISGYWEKRMEAIMCFRSQFYDPDSKEPATYISTPEFLESLKSRAHTLGRMIGVTYAESFTTTRKTGVDDFFLLK